MPFSNHLVADKSKLSKSPLPVFAERYALLHCMAETALGKIYWACDQQLKNNNIENNHTLVFSIIPALANNAAFEQALRQVIPSFQQAAPAQPTITDNGKEADGTRWLVMNNIQGMLLIERLNELDERGMPHAQALEIINGLSQAIGDYRPLGVFGFLEPGAVLSDGQNYCLLSAPIVAAIRLMANAKNNSNDNRQTYHSGFISPEVALGDQPDSTDDTFSIACIAYYLFQGEAPFGKQTTLEAAVRNLSPHSIKKLKPETWLALQQGLSLKRSERQSNPPTLLTALNKRKRPPYLLPIAALSVASLVAYASYHILAGNNPPASNNNPVITVTPNLVAPAPALVTPAPTTPATLIGEQPEPVTKAPNTTNTAVTTDTQNALDKAKAEEEARIAAIKQEAQAQAKAEIEAATASLDLAKADTKQKDIQDLLQKAETAIRAGNIFSYDKSKPAATDHLTKLFDLDPNNAQAKTLLQQLVDDQHAEANNLIQTGHKDEADKILANTDKLITEFALTSSLKRQVELENHTNTPDNKNIQATQYLDQAKRAIDYGNLTQSDGRSESAVDYLKALFAAFPENTQGMKLLEQIVTQQHEQANTALRKGDNASARKLLDSSQELIGQYTLDKMVDSQLELEKHYREGEQMGIFPATPNTPIANKTENKTETAHTTLPDNKEGKEALATNKTPNTADKNTPQTVNKPVETKASKPAENNPPKASDTASSEQATPAVENKPDLPTGISISTPTTEAEPKETQPPKEEVILPPETPIATVPETSKQNPPVTTEAQVAEEPVPPAPNLSNTVFEPATPAPAANEPTVPPTYDIPANSGNNVGNSNTAPTDEIPMDLLDKGTPNKNETQ